MVLHSSLALTRTYATKHLTCHRYGSLAATGKGHMTPQALMMGFLGHDAETIDTGTVEPQYQSILSTKSLLLNGTHRIKYDMQRDMVWRFDQVLPTHPNGMRFSVFDGSGDLLATNEYFSVGGGFGELYRFGSYTLVS